MEEIEGVGGGGAKRYGERLERGGDRERESMDGEERDMEWTYIIREPEPVCTRRDREQMASFIHRLNCL